MFLVIVKIVKIENRVDYRYNSQLTNYQSQLLLIMN